METLQVNIHEAKTNLSRLIQEAPEGKEVVIAKGNQPRVRLEVLPEAKPQRRIGQAKDVVLSMADDFDAPLDDFQEYMS
ncbi:MAG: type II toxin-antitoxin system prevent-host-death family antitoxin [Deltaproteobacteria bacterium]|nr:type II toxin-antitoxin system prevent-host-death family antitoxin [Deltaproteobacteria bacterium]